MRCEIKLEEKPKKVEAVDCVVIRDVGHSRGLMTVTNDAEAVVRTLLQRGDDGGLLPGQRLFYYDSEGRLDELLHDGKKFTGYGLGVQGV